VQLKDDGEGGFDRALRERVAESFGEFLQTLDAALAAPTSEALDEVRRHSDRVLRAVARVRLEAERIAAQRASP
jgi:hypothetical protein